MVTKNITFKREESVWLVPQPHFNIIYKIGTGYRRLLTRIPDKQHYYRTKFNDVIARIYPCLAGSNPLICKVISHTKQND